MKNEVIDEKECKKNISANTIIITALIALGGFVSISKLSDSKKQVYFTKEKTVDGDYITTGLIEYEQLKNCYLVQIKDDSLNTDEYYICEKNLSVLKQDTIKYTNILDNEDIFECSSLELSLGKNGKTIISATPLANYLNDLGYLESEYTFEDVENILEEIKSNIIEENKILIKTKINENYVQKIN